jgi:predicted RNase H-like HicB family nuclease
MKPRVSKAFSYSVFYEQAPEGGYVASIPALRVVTPLGETLEETEGNVVEAIALYLESLEAHGEAIPDVGPIVPGENYRSHLDHGDAPIPDFAARHYPRRQPLG